MNASIERVLSQSHKWNGESKPSENDDREAIWAIRPRWSTLYFVLFTFQVVVGLCIAAYDGISSTTPENWIQTYFDIILRTGQVGIVAAIITFTVIEILGSIMLLSHWERLRGRRQREERDQAIREGRKLEQERQEGRQEGRAELIAEIEEWDRRRRAAEQRGETFDEPLPYLENGSSNHQN